MAPVFDCFYVLQPLRVRLPKCRLVRVGEWGIRAAGPSSLPMDRPLMVLSRPGRAGRCDRLGKTLRVGAAERVSFGTGSSCRREAGCLGSRAI